MNWMEFVASLVSSIAWPTAIVVAVLVFREQLVALLSGQLQRLKAGPFEMQFYHQVASIEAELGLSSDQIDASRAVATGGDLGTLAQASPTEAVIRGHARVEAKLREALNSVDASSPAMEGIRHLAGAAERHGLISMDTVRAIDGITVLRNLAIHGHANALSAERARDYLALVEVILRTLDKGIPK